jgi:hypothetical protein
MQSYFRLVSTTIVETLAFVGDVWRQPNLSLRNAAPTCMPNSTSPVRRTQAPVCTENLIRFDYVTEPHTVGDDGRNDGD